MSKLITPIQYGPVLDGFNEVKPLTLADDMKGEVCLPILNSNVANSNQSAAAVFARCISGGGLLKDKSDGFANVELLDSGVIIGNDTVSLTFTVKPSYVQMIFKISIGTPVCQWCDSTYTKMFRGIDHIPYCIRTNQNTYYFKVTAGVMDAGIIYLRGFSN